MNKRDPSRIPKLRRWRGNGKDYASVYINSRRIHCGRYGTEASIEKYHRLVAEWLASGRSATFGLPSRKTTLGELIADYDVYCEEYYGSEVNSELHRVGLVGRRLRELYGSLPADEFGPLQYKAFRELLICKGQSRDYINDSMKRVVRMFRWAASECRTSPVIHQTLASVPGLKRGRTRAPDMPPVLPIDDATVDATLPHLSEVVADMVRFQRLTGCRPAEVCFLRPCDVDRSGDVWAYRPQRHKTQHLGRDRVIAIGPKAQAVLLRYIVRDAQSRCFSPRDSLHWQLEHRQICYKKERKTPVYPCELRAREKAKRSRTRLKGRRVGAQYDPRSYRRAIAYGCKKAGIMPWAPNRLRHSAATEIRKRFGLEAAQVVLGHAQASVTQVYAERDYDLAASVAKQVG